MADRKIALVTGANKGIGLEVARQLGQQNIRVVLGARDTAKGEAAAQTLRSEGIDARAVRLDVTNADDITALPAFFENLGGLDILVNNAGQQNDTAPGGVTVDNLRATYEANVFGPYAITEAILPLLRKSPAGRIVNHSSILGSLETVGSGQAGDWGTAGYTSSKAALNMLTVVWANQLKNTTVKVNAAHPGWVKTDMGGSDAPLNTAEGAKTAVWLATLPDDGPTGGFFHNRERLPW